MIQEPVYRWLKPKHLKERDTRTPKQSPTGMMAEAGRWGIILPTEG